MSTLSVQGPSVTSRLCLFDDDWITWVVKEEGTYYERDLLDAIRALGPPDVYVDGHE